MEGRREDAPTGTNPKPLFSSAALCHPSLTKRKISRIKVF
jgi:hypothetical protein